MFDRKLCLATLFVASMLATAQGKNFVEHTDNEQGHIAAREKKSSKPSFSILLNGSLDIPVEGIQN